MAVDHKEWGNALDAALAKATPEEVLDIMEKIKGWLHGFCRKCGAFTNEYNGNQGCDCPKEYCDAK